MVKHLNHSPVLVKMVLLLDVEKYEGEGWKLTDNKVQVFLGDFYSVYMWRGAT